MKDRRVVAVWMACFSLAIVALLWTNRDTLQSGRTAQAEGTITVTRAGETLCTLDAELIRSVAPEAFEATMRPSGQKPKNVVYKGAPASAVLAAAGVNLTGAESAVFHGADGYVAAVSMDELLRAGEVYIVYEADDEPLKSRADGGDGPYQLVIRGDYYSQRWCKYLSEVEIA